MDLEFSNKLIKAMSRFVYLSNERLAVKGIALMRDPLKNLSSTQQQFIIKLRNEGCVRMSQLADYLVMKRPNATRFASDLIRQGWCEKMYKGDKRHVYLVLSQTGLERLKENARIAVDYYMQLLNEHVSDEEQRKMLDFYLYVNGILEKLPQ